MKRVFHLLLATLAAVALAVDAGAADRLDARRGAIVPIAAFTATGATDALARALDEGLQSGLSVSDIREILIQMYAYCGFPRSLTALETFRNVVKSRKARGKDDPEGEAPRALPACADKSAIGTATQTALLGRPAAAPVYAFAPAIDQFLKEHLFCDIFSRGVLSHQERELATVAALAALPAESQLRAHLKFSLNTGLTPEELGDVADILAKKVGEAPAALARATPGQVLQQEEERGPAPGAR